MSIQEQVPLSERGQQDRWQNVLPNWQNTTGMEASHREDTYITSYRTNKNHKEKAFKRLSGQPEQKKLGILDE